MTRLAAGDDAALREAYRQHRDGVRAFAHRLLDDGAAADDLVHEVFVALPRAARRFRREHVAAPVSDSMAVNHARHHVRAAARRRRAQLRLGEQPVAPTVTPERVVESQQLGARWRRRSISFRSICASPSCCASSRSDRRPRRPSIVGTSDGNVRLRLFHARRRLRSLLDAWRTRRTREDTK